MCVNINFAYSLTMFKWGTRYLVVTLRLTPIYSVDPRGSLFPVTILGRALTDALGAVVVRGASAQAIR